MRFIGFQFALILILAAGLCLPLASSAQTPEAQTPEPSAKKPSQPKGKPAAAKATQKKSEEQASMPAAPPPPTPEQLPSQPPTVTYENGQLAIVAPNSTLSDILHAVRNKTGANIEIPPGANERVVSSFGPGPARDVLTSLLNGSHFNYVMVGTVADPNAVAQVILTPRAGGETPPAVQAGQAAAGMPIRPGVAPHPNPQQPQVQNQMAVEEPASSDGMDEEEASQDTNVDNSVDQGAPEQGQGTEGQNPNQPVVKTPEQLLQELQRQQQMVQQQQPSTGQQQQQPQVVTPTPPPDSRPQPR
jgi:hypothetical protein